MLFCGMCPYEDRCVFLHDPLTRSLHSGLKCRPIRSLKSFGGGSRDSFFWPDMDTADVDKNLDPASGLPSPNQPYTIPARFRESRSQVSFFSPPPPFGSHMTHTYHLSLRDPRPPSQLQIHDAAIYSIWTHFIYFLQSCRSGTSLSAPSDLEASSTSNLFVPRARLTVFVQMCTLLSDDGPESESVEALCKGLSSEGSLPGSPVARDARCDDEFKPDMMSAAVVSGSPTSVAQLPRLLGDFLSDPFADFSLAVFTGAHEHKHEFSAMVSPTFSPTSVAHAFSPPSPMPLKDVRAEAKWAFWGRPSYRTVLCED